MNFPEQFAAINKAETLDQKINAVLIYLDFLCETPGCRAILKKLLSATIEVKTEGNVLKIFMPWSYTDHKEKKTYAKIIFSEPFTGSYHESTPTSFRKVFTRHNGISYFLGYGFEDEKYPAWQIFGVNENGVINDNGSWEREAINKGGNDDVLSFLEQQGKGVADILCIGEYDECQNWYLLHPMKQNRSGESTIIRFDHCDCDMSSEESFSFGLGGVIIREMAWWIREIQ